MDLETPITTQEQLNDVIRDRLARERSKVEAKYSDYDEIKTQLEKANEARDAAVKEASDLKAADEARKSAEAAKELRAKVAKETGVPADLLRGGTEDELKAHAEAIRDAYKPKSAPKLGEAGRSAGDASGDSDGAMREFVSELFK